MTQDDVSIHLDDPEFQSILVDCYRAMENDSAIEWDELQTKHPQFAAALQALKGDAEFLGTLARSRGSNYESDESELTLDSNTCSHEFYLGDHVKYVGEYEILEEIARGGMGIVFKARQQKLDRIVALKMILSGQLADEADVQRFHREAQAAGKLRHRGIVAVHEIGQHEGHHYFTMDYIQGHSLADEIRDETLSPAQAADLVKEISEAVHFAHQQGTTHRDLKPANILIDEQQRPHVTDFGLAKVIRDDDTRANLTATGQILGTPSYMSPEQASGNVELTGPSTDIYSLGAILYACLTGRAPFVAQSPVETLLQVVNKEPIPPTQLNPSVPRDLETICLKCLDKKPSRRYPTAQALAEDLARITRGEPVMARPITKAEKLFRLAKRNPVVTSLMATTLALSLVAAAIFINGYRQTSLALEIAAGEIYGNQIALAARDLEDQHRNQAVWTLKNTQKQRRGWEWRHLMNKCYPSQFAFSEVDGNTQICLMERPYRAIGGRTVVIDDERYDKLGIIFDVESGKEIKQIEHFEFIPLNSHRRYALGFDPKEPLVLKVVDIVLGEVFQTIKLPAELEPRRINYTSPDHFTKVAISRDGSQVVIVRQQAGPLHWGVWSLETGQPIALHVERWARFVDLSDGGERIAFRHPDDLQEVYSIADVETGKEIFRTLDFVRHVTNDAAVYQSGESIGVISEKRKQTLYDHLNLFEDRPMKLVNLTTSSDQDYLAFHFHAESSTRHVFPKSVVEIWRCTDWRRQSRIEVDATIRSVNFSPDNELIATPIHELMGGATFAYWNVKDGMLRHSWRPSGAAMGFFSYINGAHFNADSNVIAIQSRSHQHRVGSWFVIRTPGHEATFEFDLSQAAKRIAFTDNGDQIAILDSFADDAEPVFLSAQSGSFIDPKNKPIVPTPAQLTAKPPVVLHYEQGDKPLVFPAPDGQCELLYFRPPVVPMLGAAGKGHLELKAASGLRHKLEEHVGIVTAVAFSEDNRWIATASDDGSISSGRASLLGGMADWESDALQQSAEIKVWNASTGAVVATMRGHSGIVNDLAFSPDAQRLASAGSSRPGVALDAIRGGQVIVWDPQSGQQLLSFQGDQGDFQCVAFSADGHWLAAAGERLYIWDGTPLPELEPRQPTPPKKEEPAATSGDELTPDPDEEEPLEEKLPPVPPLNYPPTTTSANLALRQVTPANFDLLAELSELEELRISHQWAIDEDSKPPVTLFRPLPQVKRLFIIAEVDHSDLQIIGGFTNLESILLFHFPGVQPYGPNERQPDDQPIDMLRPLLQCKQLSKVHIGQGVSDEQLQVLSEHPSLRSITVDSAVTGEFLSSWDKLKLEELHLNLRYSYPLKRPNLDGLASFVNLKKLSLIRGSAVGAVNLESLDQLDELTSLELTLSQFNDEDLIRATSRHKLETLRLRATKQTIPLDLLDAMEFPKSIRELHFNIWVADDEIGSLGQTVVLKILARKCPQARISHFELNWDPAHAHVPTADDGSERESKE